MNNNSLIFLNNLPEDFLQFQGSWDDAAEKLATTSEQTLWNQDQFLDILKIKI